MSIRLRTPLALLVICIIGLVTLSSLLFMTPKPNFSSDEHNAAKVGAGGWGSDSIYVDPELGGGGTIMPHLGNETAKAELGRATWKLLHTMAARYPLKPKPDERAAVKQWIIATHFQLLLKEHPPQTSSRASLSNWSCSVHNMVNKRLGKPDFDCGTLEDVYKCGCADEPQEGGQEGLNARADVISTEKETQIDRA
ncbi:hypothetical protein BGZ70_001096 [Mortierella alpina]|uniref:Sulfhydryl oxidase n=1 Tax=Mortierella alpina TaxID=64518 RepID=A0A9P6IWM8_MORAP|nr:hypothetical protein BGZ70_001096 [Mortierella alpina]